MIDGDFYKFWFVIVFNLTLLSGTLSLNENHDMVTECIEKVVQKYLNLEDLTLQMNTNLTFNFPVVRYDPRKYFHVFRIREPDAYIISVGSDLDISVSLIMDDLRINPRAKFIFICNEITYSLLKLLNNFYIHHVVLLKTSQPNLVSLYTYNPYHDNNLTEVGRCTPNYILENNMLFQSNLPTNWSKTKLTVLYVEYPPYIIDISSTGYQGIEINLINIILSHLDVNVTYVKSNYDYWGEIEGEDFTNTWGELKSRQFDFAIGWFHTKFNEHLYFDMSIAYLDDAVTFVASKAKLYHGSIDTLMRAFEMKVWFMYFTLLLTFFIIFHIIRKYSNHGFNVVRISDDILFMIKVMIETSVKFSGSNKLVHFFLSLCIFFTFYMNAAFKSKLFLLFSEKKFEHQINTLEDILDSGVGIGYHPYFNNSFENYESSIKHRIYEKSIACPFGWECTNRTANQRDIVAAQTDGQFKYFAPRDYVDEEGRALLHLTDVVIHPFPGHAFFIKGFPLFPRINRYLMIMTENGFVRYHYAKIELGNEISIQKAMLKNKKLLKKSLDFSKLIGVFYFYFIGVFVSSIVFFIEIISFHFT